MATKLPAAVALAWFVAAVLSYFAFLVPASVQQAGPYGVPVPIQYGGTGNSFGILGDGTSYIDSGMAATTPTSAITSLSLIADGGATCTDPTMSILGGTQPPGNATGGGAAIFTTSGANPNKQITGFVIGPTATVTMDIATDVVTDTAHGFEANTPISFTTTGVLPGGLTAGVRYYIKTVLSLNTYNVSATIGGAAINLTGTPAQSGVHTRVTTTGNYSWPPGVTVHGCTGVYKIDAVLNETTMTTMTTAAGRLVANGAIYNVPAYTHTYPAATVGNASIGYCDYFNTVTLAWVTDACLGSFPAPTYIFVQYVFVGTQPSWPNGPGSTQPPQIYIVYQIPGLVAASARVYTVEQQGAGQASLLGRSYPCMVTPTSGSGGCSFNGRFFGITSDDPSVAPYGETLDGGPQIYVARIIPNRPGKAGDLTAQFSAATQDSAGGLMQAFQIVALTVDPTPGASQAGILFATSSKDAGGSSNPSFEAIRGLVLCNYLDACAPHKGADTINLNDRLNTDNYSPGLYMGGVRQGQTPAQGRLTLANLTPVQVTSVAGATVIYWTPYVGDRIQIRRGLNYSEKAFSQLSNITSNSATGKAGPAAVAANSNYDLFVWDDAGTLRLTRGGAWNTATVRSATTENDLVLSEGIWLNLNNITNGPNAGYGTYVGTMCSNAASTIDYIFGANAAGGTAGRFCVWNMYNRRDLNSLVRDTTATWNPLTANYEALNASNTNRHTFIRGLNEDGVSAILNVSIQNAGGVTGLSAIGLNVTNAPAAESAQGYVAVGGLGGAVPSTAHYSGTPGLGLNFLQALQQASAITTLFIGSNLEGFSYKGLH